VWVSARRGRQRGSAACAQMRCGRARTRRDFVHERQVLQRRQLFRHGGAPRAAAPRGGTALGQRRAAGGRRRGGQLCGAPQSEIPAKRATLPSAVRRQPTHARSCSPQVRPRSATRPRTRRAAPGACLRHEQQTRVGLCVLRSSCWQACAAAALAASSAAALARHAAAAARDAALTAARAHARTQMRARVCVTLGLHAQHTRADPSCRLPRAAHAGARTRAGTRASRLSRRRAAGRHGEAPQAPPPRWCASPRPSAPLTHPRMLPHTHTLAHTHAALCVHTKHALSHTRARTASTVFFLLSLSSAQAPPSTAATSAARRATRPRTAPTARWTGAPSGRVRRGRWRSPSGMLSRITRWWRASLATGSPQSAKSSRLLQQAAQAAQTARARCDMLRVCVWVWRVHDVGERVCFCALTW
jgi:hypothetical protein